MITFTVSANDEFNYTGVWVRVRLDYDSRGRPIKATLQRRIGVDVETGRELWEDVRPLEVRDDGTIVLGSMSEETP